MIGLFSLGFLAGYIFLIVLAARFGAHLARRTGHSPKLWGFIAGLLVYLPVFWDFIPTVALECYYCATQGGFTQYKTLDEWKQENPGVSETLVPSKGSVTLPQPNIYRQTLNHRFFREWTRTPRSLYISESTHRIVDSKTGEVMAKYVDFDTKIGDLTNGLNSQFGYKFWLNFSSCKDFGIDPEGDFYHYSSAFENQKEFEK